MTFSLGEETIEVRYRGLRVEGVEQVWSATPTEVELTVDGVRRRIRVSRRGSTAYVDDDGGSTVLAELERFPLPEASVSAGSLLAHLPGSVVRVLVETGVEVTKGQLLLVLEAMKMEHSVQSPVDGRVGDVLVTFGQQVETGQVLVVVEEAGDG